MKTAKVLEIIRNEGPLSLSDDAWTHAPDMLAHIRAMVARGELCEGTDRHEAPGFACLPGGATEAPYRREDWIPQDGADL